MLFQCAGHCRVETTLFASGLLSELQPIKQWVVWKGELEEGKRNLEERLERLGYFDSQVEYGTDTHEVKGNGKGWQGTEEIITYKVKRGERHKLIGIEIKDNKYFDTELLQSRLQIFHGAFASGGRFSRRLEGADTNGPGPNQEEHECDG